MTKEEMIIVLLCLQCVRHTDNFCALPTYTDAHRCKWDEANELREKIEKEYKAMTN